MKHAKIAGELTTAIYEALKKAALSDVDVTAVADPDSNAKDVITMHKGDVVLHIAVEREFIQYGDGKTMYVVYSEPGMVHAYAYFKQLPGTQMATIHRCKGELDLDYTDGEGSIDVKPFFNMFENAVNQFDKIAKLMDAPVC